MSSMPSAGPRTGEGGGQYSPPLAVHNYIFFLLGILGGLLGVKHATGDLPSPFVTYHKTVQVFIADLFAYVGALTTAKIFQASNNTNIYERMNNISLLCGTLALILMALLLDPNFGGLVTLLFWVICFVNVVFEYTCNTSGRYKSIIILVVHIFGKLKDYLNIIILYFTKKPKEQIDEPPQMSSTTV
ncbi:hypothetical protein D8674_036113 [Pyrus ussuriensis x Pyrus communis]|uniref:Uncharacterized protein n=1 Tax=Pyrus ussuriensis x Pyrus communis TaxID=2448454 RepID=A0A5N5GF84_9ROSA|nr:hypothetical protein D8674_036113 [Pyrus ussuriensis x Pyrus communis]